MRKFFAWGGRRLTHALVVIALIGVFGCSKGSSLTGPSGTGGDSPIEPRVPFGEVWNSVPGNFTMNFTAINPPVGGSMGMGRAIGIWYTFQNRNSVRVKICIEAVNDPSDAAGVGITGFQCNGYNTGDNPYTQFGGGVSAVQYVKYARFLAFRCVGKDPYINYYDVWEETPFDSFTTRLDWTLGG